MASKKKQKIGVLFTNKDSLYYRGMYEGIMEYAKRLDEDYEIIYEESTFTLENHCKKLAELSKKNLSGLIITPIDNPEVYESFLAFYEKNIPIITLNTDLPNANRLAFIGCDNYKCGRATGELMQLITRGKAEVAIITGSHEMLSHELRIRGFCDYLKENSPKITVEEIIECKNDDYTAYDMTNRLLLAHPTLSALFFAAGGVSGACKALDQMTVPRDISVVTFDILDNTKDYLKKGIITAALVQYPHELGEKAMQTMDDYLREGRRPENTEILSPISVMLKEMV